MRMVVCVLEEEKVRYLLADGDQIREIAQIVTPDRFEVTDAVKLGINLIDTLSLNGAPPKPPRPAAVPRALPALPKGRRTPKHPLNIQTIAAYIAQHPGCTSAEIGEALAPGGTGNTSAVQLVNNRVMGYFNRMRPGEAPLFRREMNVTTGGRMKAFFYPPSGTQTSTVKS